MLELGIREIASGDLELPKTDGGNDMHIPTPSCCDVSNRGGRNVTHEKEGTFRGVGLAYLVEKEPGLFWRTESAVPSGPDVEELTPYGEVGLGDEEA